MRKNKRIRVFKIEKLLIKFCLFLIVLFPIVCVISKASLSDINLEVERLKRSIETEQKTVESLSMKVDELQSIANVQTVVESEGLSYNSSKIKVIVER